MNSSQVWTYLYQVAGHDTGWTPLSSRALAKLISSGLPVPLVSFRDRMQPRNLMLVVRPNWLRPPEKTQEGSLFFSSLQMLRIQPRSLVHPEQAPYHQVDHSFLSLTFETLLHQALMVTLSSQISSERLTWNTVYCKLWLRLETCRERSAS